MTPEDVIRNLLNGSAQPPGHDDRAAERRALRLVWAEATLAQWLAAHKRVQAAWDRIFDSLPEDLDEEELEAIPQPPEQAELDALHAQIRAAVDQDKWPRHLYWSL